MEPGKESIMKHLLSTFLVLLLSLCFVHSKSESVKEPFILKSGAKYRDMLTIMASQAVADYADTYSRRQEREIQRNKVVNKNPIQSPKFYSLRLDTPTGVSAETNALYFSTSRHITIDSKQIAERVIADKDEEIIVAEKEGVAPPAEQTDRRTSHSAPLVSQLSSRRHAPKKKGPPQNRYLYKTATKYGSPSSSYSIIRAPGINVGIDTNHAQPQARSAPAHKRTSYSHTPAYSYTINTGSAYRSRY
ncbi:uncharacterized protein [Lepeophtheirus salmonis]|uniref:uncharacterized protein n=1 Tax=Lepeophtheirus salmonis TaxID=72036 RepID=UPI001AEB9A6C|nr:uncharacterized protein LOC121114564 [Lepeophtheirus salmonis]XP_040564507.1 uncharacterized protein LOC121114564 [Lepeophtheirus salmonis]XP_040564515.1 uncharacterized protein LOC121114564 [Lepeophtheirus salmonis]XP_040564522.1 uncharacterized protein LOC121114564 [Lepeophtheirus salmonis]XP_040564530.1 uncharacterized protein LOC121114564 [Lepeophtheirus salmonis]